jgi:hypothetical protein
MRRFIMTTRSSIKTITAVVFAISLILGSSARASMFGFDRDLASRTTAAERPISLFEQVSAWLAGAWNNLTSVFATDTTTPPPTTQGNCDAGLGLDPEGCQR